MAAVAKQSTIAGGALSVDALPSSTLTPNFFNSIFNDGMNPFDEYFAGSATPGNLASISASTRKEHLHSDKPRLIKDDTLPSINTKLDQTLTPEQSPKSLNATDSSSLLSHLRLSRSPSPFAYSIATTFPDSPVSSITPITSPEELTPGGAMAREQITTSTTLEQPVASRKSFGASSTDKSSTLHKRNMSLPQAWDTNGTGFPSIPDVVEPKPESLKARRQTLPKGVECQVKPATRARQRLISDTAAVQQFSRMDGIFVTENIPSAEVKTEPTSPTTPSFQSVNSTAAGRKRKRSSIDLSDDDDEIDGKLNESDKRARFLERNRIAASKCRKKKKIMNQRLEEKSRLLVQQNRFLNATLVKLRSDVLRLKQMVLTHHGCGNPAIEQYLQQESEKYLVADGEEAAKRKEDARLANSLAKSAGINGIVKPDTFHSNAGGSNSAWLNEFHSFEEVESEVLKRPHLLDFDDEDFQKLLLGDQLTGLDDDFATSPPAFD